MDLEMLKAEYPDLVQAIRSEAIKEGADAERARIQSIEEIAMAGHEALVTAAKFDGITTAEMLAVQMVKAEKARNARMLDARQEDAKALAGLEGEGNEGVEPANGEKKVFDANVSHLQKICNFGG